MKSYFLFFFFCFSQAYAQSTFPQNGVYDEQEDHYCFYNANIYISPDKFINDGVLIIKEGKVVDVGVKLAMPDDAIKIDLQNRYIYPSFVELSSDYGLPKPDKDKKRSRGPQMLSSKEGAYSWNEALIPEQNAAEDFVVNEKQAKALRNIGFGVVLTHHRDGMARGTSALVLLGNGNEHDQLIQKNVSTHYSFSKGSSKQNYPSSRMGAIALLRQANYDALWYAEKGKDKEFNLSLQQWNLNMNLPQFFEVGNKLDLLRADKIGDEFNIQYIIRGKGDEYQRLSAIKASNAPLIVPLNFPDAYDLSDPYDAEELSLAQLKHWEMAPANPAKIQAAGIKYCLTSDLLKDKSSFLKALRTASQYGLSEEDILKALTTTPAAMIKASSQIGTLEKDKLANFFISSHSILSENVVFYEHWIKGKAHRINDMRKTDIRGSYQFSYGDIKASLEIDGSFEKPSAKFMPSKKHLELIEDQVVDIALNNYSLSFMLKFKGNKQIRFSGNVQQQNWSGQAFDENGDILSWTAIKKNDFKAAPVGALVEQVDFKDEVLFPWSGYGFSEAEQPKAESCIFRNATVWTGEEEGILSNTDVHIENGQIVNIGKGLQVKDAKIIDASGKHLTAGIIDEHAHICINFGVNEGTQASSAEVRIGDVINSEDVNMYRQLAGGVIGAQLLHGSANPIGGQSALVKFRWGALPEEMKIENADGYIKFALGENVKQSNWGSESKVRFPQTRMGVEQVYEDHFTRAYEYGAAIAEGKNPRKDLELEALLEIINKERFISCHSYVQSEITMLMRIAEKYGFTLNTFTHILEGYKVADKMKLHGAGASTFSDWWGYKYEVKDAIPYNAKILDDMGIVVAVNSDDAEMGRRLNQEAAKGIKYGGMSEAAAWNMVTLNPAKLLHIDDQTGSIKKGKSADLVLWSDNPLSIYAKAEQTYVDGKCLFDASRDKDKRAYIQSERNRLIQKLLKLKTKGVKTQPPIYSQDKHYRCCDVDCNELIDYNK